MSNPPPDEIRLTGLAVSPGIALGRASIRGHKFIVPVERKIGESEVDAEWQRFEIALDATHEHLEKLRVRIAKRAGKLEANIFEAHLLILRDVTVMDETKRLITEDLINVDSAYFSVMRRYIDGMSEIKDQYLQERIVDMQDVLERVLRNLRKESDVEAEETGTFVLVAHDLTPSDTAAMDRDKVLGFVTEAGSVTSHSSIMARSLGIPAVTGLHDISRRLRSGQRVLVDGYKGLLFINPSGETLKEYEGIQEQKNAIASGLEELREDKAKTASGRRIILSANIEFASEVNLVRKYGAEGVGLYRTEFLYLSGKTLPGEEEQFNNYKKILDGLGGEEMIIRTLDVGGDKLTGDEEHAGEMNPYLGWRGIRLSLEQPHMFRQQIRAILRCSAHGKLGVMFPLISSGDEIKRARDLVDSCKSELDSEGIPFDGNIPIGAMIEVPSAALIADQLAGLVDFFSVGTNDLIQYTIAVDRGNDRVAKLYQPTHPAILRLLKNVTDAAHEHDIWAGICGEMAGDIVLTPLLVGLGVDELSVIANQIPRVKQAILRLDDNKCRELVEELLTMSEAERIFTRCREVAIEHYPELLV
ncbi:MAG: phosphoenolpyruvate--protein phosphotransferase [Verrucomicrobiota bacterium]